MNFDNIITACVLVTGFYLIFFIGKLVNDFLHKEYNLTYELVEKDNPAIALSVAGYYFGLVISIGGSLVGPSLSIADDIMDLCIYGLLSIVLLNISWFLCDKIILYKFKISDELLRDQNQGTGAVSFGVSVASGLVIFGAISGEGGNIWTAVTFWAIGQFILLMSVFLYNFIIPYDLHDEIEKDNVAAGVSLAGAIISMGIIVGLAAEGDFHSWSEDLVKFISITVLGLVIMPLIRMLTDKILLPTVKLSDEIAAQKVPNIGAAYIEALSYIGSALVITWCV